MRLVLTRVGVLQARAHRCHSSFLGMQPSCRGRTRAIGRRWQQGSHGCPSCRLPQIHGLRMRARPELLSLAWARHARVVARGRRCARMRIALGRAARACTRVGAFGHHAPRAKRVCACPLSWPARGSICRSWSFVVGRAAMHAPRPIPRPKKYFKENGAPKVKIEVRIRPAASCHGAIPRGRVS